MYAQELTQHSHHSPCGGPDRRAAERVTQEIRVLLREDRFATSGYTVNIGPGGALIRTSAPLRLGARYDFYVQWPDELHRVQATVLRELPGYIYAVQFCGSIIESQEPASGAVRLALAD